jgi:glycosyltransferase involved in cell wall biosynthesis
MAEAMYLQKPVIATGYSGNMEFMNVNNSLLVRYELKELDRDYEPYEKGSVWAEPDVDHAAELMRRVYQEREKAKSIGEKASKDIRQQLSPRLASQEIRARLQELYHRFRTPVTTGS